MTPNFLAKFNVAANSSKYVKFPRLYNSQWTYQLIIPWTFILEMICKCPRFNKFQIANQNPWWTIPIIGLITIHEHARGIMKCSKVLEPSPLWKRFWCLQLIFDCQERWSNEIHSCVTSPNLHSSRMAVNSCLEFWICLLVFYKPHWTRFGPILWVVMTGRTFIVPSC